QCKFLADNRYHVACVKSWLRSDLKCPHCHHAFTGDNFIDRPDQVPSGAPSRLRETGAIMGVIGGYFDVTDSPELLRVYDLKIHNGQLQYKDNFGWVEVTSCDHEKGKYLLSLHWRLGSFPAQVDRPTYLLASAVLNNIPASGSDYTEIFADLKTRNSTLYNKL